MAKYVPPSRRPGYVPSQSSIPARRQQYCGKDTYNSRELAVHFTHPSDSTLTFFSHPLPLPPPRLPYDPSRTPYSTPLPPSPVVPPKHPLNNLISFIRIFARAHPAWASHRELWVHTQAEKIIEDYQGAKANFGRPIPVFEAAPLHGEKFVDAGWWVVQDMMVVLPHSDELKRMLTFKDEKRAYRGGRSAEAWEQSLSETWLKLKLTPAPPSGAAYTDLKQIMSLTGGIDGEVERYMLQMGGLSDEVEVLESIWDERREFIKSASRERSTP